MANLNMTRVEKELAWRLFNTFGNSRAEEILRQRCLTAIKNKTLKNLYAPIKFDKRIKDPYFVLNVSLTITEAKIINVINETGIYDLLCLCINAQN